MLVIIYWLCVAALFYSYVLYPLILQVIAGKKIFVHSVYTLMDQLPEVIIFFSVYNGEKVLKEKLESMLASEYPKEKLRIIVGSDESIDGTDDIVRQVSVTDQRVELHRFARVGKANVLNKIREIIIGRGIKPDTVFILTDAYAIFEKNTIWEMVKHFKTTEIGIVGANYINTNIQKGGISFQEKSYIQRENLIKYWESVSFGSMMGVYGACYAIRGIDLPVFPGNILMEDFYVTMMALKRGQKSILTLDAKFYENIPNSIDIEFKRKKRIAAGNFQNLFYFKSLLNPVYGATTFAFLSHKVLRWTGPLFILLSYIACFFLAFTGSVFFQVLLVLHIFVLTIPLLDYCFKKFGVTITLFRFVSYFISMNIAVAAGFWWYIRGIKTNIWQPTARS